MTHPTPIRCAALALAAVLATGCASGPNAHPQDPFEPYNRSMSTFNENVDKAVLKPVATLYQDVAPSPVQTGVRNFFGNLGDAWSMVNNLLQGKGRAAFDSMVRVTTNTVFGIGGLLDIASEAGIERHRQDFGLTLGHWGVGSGPYLVLPLLGPSSLRDTTGLVVDWYGDALGYLYPVSHRNSLYVLRFVDKRAQLLGATQVLDGAALDPYAFTRDVYLRLRAQQAGSGDMAGDDEEGGKLPEDY